MERRGVPSMLVCTTAFKAMATFEARSHGLPDVEVLVIGHPIVTKNREQLDDDVQQVVDQVYAFFGVEAPA
jgi:hypothetical protein